MRTSRFGLCLVALALAVGTVRGDRVGQPLHTGLRRPRGPVLPARGERGLRRPEVHAEAGLRPGDRPPRRHGDDRRRGDAGPQELQPRPARVPDGHEHQDRDEAGLQDGGGRVVALRAGADRLPAREAARADAVLRRGRVRGHRRADHRPGRLDRGLRPDGRRRLRRQRAAGLARLVPGQRQPERQGALRHVDHGPRGAAPRSATAASSRRRRRTARRRGTGASRCRWRRTSPPPRTAAST